ncbi:GNAT family N-acetyltransferase [Paenarthrobacter ureafaciens]|uniref:GNAT family N-acetyltransferase n=1 Tax=Paenarthrobacter ureafaciens TaxID=37931 RepID=UPI001CE4B2B9
MPDTQQHHPRPVPVVQHGYWLSKDQTGKGLATEAVRAAVAYAYAYNELKLHRV